MKKETVKTVNNLSYKPLPEHFERNDKPSLAVPGMSLSIKEILEKHTLGISPTVSKIGQFPDEEPDFDDIEYDLTGYDLTDIDVANHIIGEIQDHARKAVEAEKARQIAKERADLEALKKNRNDGLSKVNEDSAK